MAVSELPQARPGARQKRGYPTRVYVYACCVYYYAICVTPTILIGARQLYVRHIEKIGLARS